jgi:hypothetical protein
MLLKRSLTDGSFLEIEWIKKYYKKRGGWISCIYSLAHKIDGYPLLEDDRTAV